MSSMQEKLIAVLLGVPATTFGQSVLLYILFPNFMVAHEIWVLVGLFLFDFGLAGLLLIFCYKLITEVKFLPVLVKAGSSPHRR